MACTDSEGNDRNAISHIGSSSTVINEFPNSHTAALNTVHWHKLLHLYDMVGT